MTYNKLKDANDAEREKQELVNQILKQKDNLLTRTVLLTMDSEALEGLIKPVKLKTKKSES